MLCWVWGFAWLRNFDFWPSLFMHSMCDWNQPVKEWYKLHYNNVLESMNKKVIILFFFKTQSLYQANHSFKVIKEKKTLIAACTKGDQAILDLKFKVASLLPISSCSTYKDLLLLHYLYELLYIVRLTVKTLMRY